MASHDNFSKALFLFKSSQWKLYGIEFRHLRQLSDVYKQSDVISADDADGRDEQRIVSLCEAVTPESIYQKVGKGKFRSQKLFFEKAEASVRRHVERLIGKRICEAVQLASSLNIPIFFKPGPHEFVEPDKQLLYNEKPLPLHTLFRKADDGLDYKLTVGNGLCPAMHRTVVLSDKPSLFVIDNNIFHFEEGLNGKLLSPFVSHKWIHIPQRLEDEYFRKWILKIATKIDIDADGFQVEEKYPKGKGLISLEKNISGSYSLSLSFDYDGKIFAEKSTREKNVTLYDGADGVSFVCINRNREWESMVRHTLDDELHMPHHGTLSAILEWARKNREQFEKHGLTMEQLTSHHYYIGDVKIIHDESRRGDWFQIHIRLDFGNGMTVPLMAMRRELVNGEKEFLLPNGEWFVIPDEWLARFTPLALFGKREDDKLKNDVVSVHRSQTEVLDNLQIHPEIIEQKRQADYSLPRGLNATLRVYQVEGYRWLLGHFYANTGCCLSDDMGLGKTIQSIALILKYKESACTDESPKRQPSGKSKTMELSLFSDEEMTGKSNPSALPVLVVAPASVVHNWRNEISRFAPTLKVLVYTGTIAERTRMRGVVDNYDVVVTTYATMRNDIDRLASMGWGMTIFDESQVFKNSSSLIYEATKRLSSPVRIALSGTPMENNLRELWSLMSVLNPSLLGDSREFKRNFINPISNDLKSKNTDLLRKLVEPYFLRRTKAEVLSSLPERQDEIVYCDMEPQQASLYAEVESRMRNVLMEDRKLVNTMNVLSTITRLRQIACSPELVGSDAPSGKLQEVYDRLEELRGTNHKVLIFSEYVSLLNFVAKEMDARDWDYAELTGETRDRESVINYFQREEQCQFFLISLKAGGLGLNLTEADYVFLLDPWWNNTAEEQAISRAHRQGQRRSVFVYRFISTGTLEDEILKVQNRKQSLINAVLSCLNK